VPTCPCVPHRPLLIPPAEVPGLLAEVNSSHGCPSRACPMAHGKEKQMTNEGLVAVSELIAVKLQ